MRAKREDEESVTSICHAMLRLEVFSQATEQCGEEEEYDIVTKEDGDNMKVGWETSKQDRSWRGRIQKKAAKEGVKLR